MEQTNLICLNRNTSDERREYCYKIVIRICRLEADTVELSDCYPKNLHIRVCKKLCPISLNCYTRTPKKDKNEFTPPIDCSQLLKLNPGITNKVTVNWVPDGNNYVMNIFLVKHLTSEMLLKKLQDKEAVSSEITKNYIIKKLHNMDSDLATTFFRFSLACPMTMKRMKIPAKSKKCKHLQCFDAHSFILMNEKKSKWLCPTCNNQCLYDDLVIETYFYEIVTNANLSDSCNQIELLPDGSWKEIHKITKSEGTDPEEKDIDSVDLVDSDDGNGKHLTKELIKKEENSNSEFKDKIILKSFIDLTTDDVEDNI